MLIRDMTMGDRTILTGGQIVTVQLVKERLGTSHLDTITEGVATLVITEREKKAILKSLGVTMTVVGTSQNQGMIFRHQLEKQMSQTLMTEGEGQRAYMLKK